MVKNLLIESLNGIVGANKSPVLARKMLSDDELHPFKAVTAEQLEKQTIQFLIPPKAPEYKPS